MPTDEESRELTCLSAMTDGRAHFFQLLVEHASGHYAPSSPHRLLTDVIAVLREDHVYQVAKFFYLLEELDLRNPSKFQMLIERQNSDMAQLLNDRSRMLLMGLNPQRVKDAMFSEDQQKKIFFDSGVDSNGNVRLDQSDLGKFLAVFMSPESCRQAVVALAEAGLLIRRGHGKVFVSSDGTLEYYFRQHLRLIDERIKGVSLGILEQVRA